MGIEQANNWRARRTNSIKLRTSDRKRHEVDISKGEGETDPVRIADMQARREAARAAAVQREEAFQNAKRRDVREARADIEHAMRGEQKPTGNSAKGRSRAADAQNPRRPAKSKRSAQKITRRVDHRESEDVRLAKALERLRDKYQ